MPDSLSNHSAEDFFEELYADPLNRAFFCVSWLLLEIVGNLLLGALIWYERCGTQYDTTLLNSLSSFTLFNVLVNNIVCVNLICFRFLIGPYPPALCTLQSSVQHFTFFAALLSINEVVIFRYLYAFRWKNIGAFNGDFFHRFLVILNHLFGFFYAALQYLLYNIYRIDYAMCSGQDPKTYSHYPLVFQRSPSTLLCLITGILYIFLHIKMFLQKRKDDLRAKERQWHPKVIRQQSCFLAMGNPSAVSDLLSTGLSVFFLITVAAIPHILLKHWYPGYPLHIQTPNSVLIPCIHLMYHFVGSLLSPLIIFARNKKIRSAIREQMHA